MVWLETLPVASAWATLIFSSGMESCGALGRSLIILPSLGLRVFNFNFKY